MGCSIIKCLYISLLMKNKHLVMITRVKNGHDIMINIKCKPSNQFANQ